MIVFLEATRPRRRRLQIRLNNEALPELDKFLRAFSVRAGWNQASRDRLASAGEETLAVLMQTSREDIPLSPNPPKGYGSGGQTREEGSGNGLART